MYLQITRVFALLATLILAAMAAPCALAIGTAAGTQINNQAAVAYVDPSGVTQTDLSNTVTLRVDEVLDVTVTRNDANDIPVLAAATSQPLSFHVTNNGNGPETFRLNTNIALVNDQFDPLAARIAFDTNNNGVYDPTVDQLYVAGQNDPNLLADQTITVFILGDIPAALSNGDRSFAALTATATTGNGPAGTIFANLGSGGGDAIVGSTTARANDQAAYVAQLVNIQFVKTQTIIDPSGSSTPIPGAIITYTLTARVTGTGQLSASAINDPVPAQTTYLAGTLALNGTPLSDAADTDAGQASNAAIFVALGTLVAPATQTVTFQVKLN
jgi:uncharacterized repeat protein (TIGR01451 family)